MDDVRAAAETIDGPVVPLGHSMGGLVALDLAIDGLSNGIEAWFSPIPTWPWRLKLPQSRSWAPRCSRLLPRLANELDATLICRNQPVVDKYLEDPLVYSTITPRWFTEMLLSQKRVVANATHYETPLLMLLGEGDAICDWKASAGPGAQLGRRSPHHYLSRVVPRIFNEVEESKSARETHD